MLRRFRILILILIILLGLGAAGQVLLGLSIQQPRLRALAGKVELRPPTSNDWRTASEGAELFPQSELRTKAGSLADIYFPPKQVVRLLENSWLRALGVRRGFFGTRSVPAFRLVEGELFMVAEPGLAGEQVNIFTATSVTAVRGTVFSVEALKDGSSKVRVLIGSAQVTGLAVPTKEITVPAGYATVIAVGAAAEAPTKLSPAEEERLKCLQESLEQGLPMASGFVHSPYPSQVDVGLPRLPSRTQFLFSSAQQLKANGLTLTVNQRPGAIVQLQRLFPSSQTAAQPEEMNLYSLLFDPPAQDEAGTFDLILRTTAGQESRLLGYVTYTEAVHAETALLRGLGWIRANQRSDGSWAGDVGVTALAVLALANAGYPSEDPSVASGTNFLLSNARQDGSISNEGHHAMYQTALATVALSAASSTKYRQAISAARDWIVTQQWDESEGITSADEKYGGFGYGDGNRPDLSNTQFAALALDAAGLSKSHPAWRKLQTFLSRCQNLAGVNDLSWAGKDGGFVYLPGQSLAGGTKSYGSMTAAGIWCLLLSGVNYWDERVQAAFNWFAANYTWKENPGHGNNFHYYFCMSMAKAMTMMQQPVVAGHSWFAEMGNELASRQQGDGSWLNSGSEGEDTREVATCFALLALETGIAATGKERVPALTLANSGPAVHLDVYDQQGNHVGFNPQTKQLESELSNARVYTQDGQQSITIFNPANQTYRIQLTGEGSGNFQVTVAATVDGETTFSAKYSGQLKAGQSLEAPLLTSAIAGPVTVYANALRSPITLRSSPLSSIFLPSVEQSLSLWSSSTQRLGGLRFDLMFDPESVEVVSVSPGKAFSRGTPSAWEGPKVDQQRGLITNIGGNLPATPGSKQIATIHFKPKPALYYASGHHYAWRPQRFVFVNGSAWDAEGGQRPLRMREPVVWLLSVPTALLALVLAALLATAVLSMTARRTASYLRRRPALGAQKLSREIATLRAALAKMEASGGQMAEPTYQRVKQQYQSRLAFLERKADSLRSQIARRRTAASQRREEIVANRTSSEKDLNHYLDMFKTGSLLTKDFLPLRANLKRRLGLLKVQQQRLDAQIAELDKAAYFLPQPQPETEEPAAPPAREPEKPAFCSQCGAQLLPGARFCSQCGHSFTDSTEKGQD